MNKLQLFLAITLSLISVTLIAQENFLKNNLTNQPSSIGIAVGMNTGVLKDLNFSPLHYSEIGPMYNLHYKRNKADKPHIFSIDLFFNNGKANTIASDSLQSRYLYADIETAYLRKIKESNDKFDFYLGPAYHLDFNFMIFNNVFESFTFLIAHNLEVQTQLNYKLNSKNLFVGSLSLPVVTLLVRPPFIGYNDELDTNQSRPLRLITNGDFVSINKYAGIFATINHLYQINSSWNTKLSYAFNYQTTEEYKQFQNQLFAGINYNF